MSDQSTISATGTNSEFWTGRRKQRFWRGVQTLLILIAAFIMLPMFALALAIRKYFVQGMTMGAVR